MPDLARWAVPIRWARRLGVAGILCPIALGWLGQAVRDRSAAWAVLLYLPLIPLGAFAIGLDALCRGRALGVRPRFTLAAVGLATTLGAAALLVNWGGGRPGDDAPAAGRSVDVLHWNVIWGGGRHRSPERWASIRRTIAARRADLIVLSEAPPDDWLDELVADLGPGGSRVQVENEPGARHWHKLVVASRWPLRLVGRVPVRNGAAMAVEAFPEGVPPVRLLVVDGLSHPLLWRSPFLDDVAGLCRDAAAAGRPFDVVLGDFNSVSRSVGFDGLAAQGYRLASRSGAGPGWRGTFPSFAPFYDIDHVWVHPARAAGLAWRLFTDWASDHRGQVVRLQLDGP